MRLFSHFHEIFPLGQIHKFGINSGNILLANHLTHGIQEEYTVSASLFKLNANAIREIHYRIAQTERSHLCKSRRRRIISLGRINLGRIDSRSIHFRGIYRRFNNLALELDVTYQKFTRHAGSRQIEILDSGKFRHFRAGHIYPGIVATRRRHIALGKHIAGLAIGADVKRTAGTLFKLYGHGSGLDGIRHHVFENRIAAILDDLHSAFDLADSVPTANREANGRTVLNVNSPEAIEAYDFIADLGARGLITERGNTDQGFDEGKTWMVISGGPTSSETFDVAQLRFPYGPRGNKDTVTTLVNEIRIWAFPIFSAYTEEEVGEVTEFLFEPLCEDFPNGWKDVIGDNLFYHQSEYEYYITAAEQSEYFDIYIFTETFELMKTALSDILNGNQNPANAIDAIYDVMNEEINAQYNN